MSPGKAASQSGHAFIGAVHSNITHPNTLEYLSEVIGTKVCLEAPNLRSMITAWVDAQLNSIPAFLVHDSGCENFYEGKPIVTSLGIGPCPTAKFLRKFKLHK